jgi:hypothetical protein
VRSFPRSGTTFSPIILRLRSRQALGSASVSYRAEGGNVVGQRYEPWGEVKGYETNQLPSDYSFTGQRLDSGMTLLNHDKKTAAHLRLKPKVLQSKMGRCYLPPTTAIPSNRQRCHDDEPAEIDQPARIEYNSYGKVSRLNGGRDVTTSPWL